MSKKKVGALFLALLLPLVFLACSSGGGGGGGGDTDTTPTTSNASALTVADQVSVVDARLSGSVAAAKPLRIGQLRPAPPADSDYNKDETNIYVQERSAEMFGIINEILCMIAQTKYDDMLNKGPYTAQIDENQCSSGRGDASQAGQESSNQSSGANAPNYLTWTVDSSRVDDNSPHILKAWIHEEAREREPAQTIEAKVTITEGKSAANPMGIFTVLFKATPPDDPNTTLFRGLLKSERDAADPNKILLKFVDGTPADAPDPRSEAVTLSKNADGSSGSGTGYRSEIWHDNGVATPKQFKFDIAYNVDFFLRHDAINTGTPDVCLDRNAFDMSAWRYGLYDAATGARVNRNSGFPIKFGNYYGHVGYWGLWLPNNVTLNNGDTVYKHNYQTNADTPYTVFVAKGKLKKHTKKNITLDSIKNIPLDYWENIPGQMNGTNFRVVWDGTNFAKKAQMPSDCSGNCTWVDITTVPTPTINFSQVQWSEINFWSQALGGQVRVPLPGCQWMDPDGAGPDPGFTSCSAPTGATNVVFFQEDIVYPNDTAVPASVVCYDNCPKAGSTGINPMDSNYPTWDPNTGQSVQIPYTFDKVQMLLQDTTSGYAVVSTGTSSINQWGYMSGALFEPTAANLNLLQCDWQNPQGGYDICGWKAWSALDVFYTWETGPNNWNQFTAVKDSTGAFVTFEPPLQVEYVHAQTNVNARDFKYNGTKFFLEYSGFGELHGIPAHCVNMDTGDPISCDQGGQGTPVRWVPEFFIPAGSLLQNGSYLAKPLEMEQRMRQSAGCAGTGLATQTYELPSISEWQDPAVGAEPAVTDAPAVVGGIVQ